MPKAGSSPLTAPIKSAIFRRPRRTLCALKKEGITQFAYAITTANFDFAPGTYTLTFTGAWADAAGNAGATGDSVITVEGATAIMVDPGAGAAIDVNLLNGRNYIDIQFPNVPDSDFVYDAASITDGGAEFTLTGAGLGTVQIDNGVAPVRVGGTDAAPIYRYWLTGSFDSGQTYGDLTIAAVEQGWSYRYSDSANPTTDPAIKSGEDGLGVVANPRSPKVRSRSPSPIFRRATCSTRLRCSTSRPSSPCRPTLTRLRA